MSWPFLLGLTGSIGMGKSTTAGFFREAGIPVWDADAAVHRLYAPGQPGARAIAALYPAAVGETGVSRAALKGWIAADATALRRIEAAVHPLVAADRAEFIENAARRGAELVVLDIPLLFETGGDAQMDGTLVVSVPPEVQRKRVLSRPGMTSAQFETILARQMPDAEKRARATWVIETLGLEPTRAAVQDLINDIRAQRHA
ncbi:dephospho-CoA kinase [Defluviimonas sp. 20V17]|uniref:Dephospho-CoA kinase n=1 Tax=Allgaiera indica TaxID=765699 RepID=A0AAN4UMJ6_9RHOB|nr:dephospho-CoA kinase [Allgaiera indica]KDB03625.1 dephospho-CoA kinase [Defluviimonas sp. 20V17]GHD98260.1 dephospho-CoA kinase [Allgaiera indica]SDW50581.1 dephospho-CoA kinase [Allgaiera indica]